MKYRKFGKTGEELSILGFGAMRLPILNGEDTNIDYLEASKMVRYAIDNGVNYLDTAYPYHGGNSEIFCAHVMKDGYREKINIATKLPVWDVKEYADMERILDEQLSKLEVDCIDFYLLHALSIKSWPNMVSLDYKSFLEKARKDGKIKYIGFSFHDSLDLFKEITDDYNWDFCQIQLNYMDDNYQSGVEGMKYAHDKGMGVIIMEPLRGGMLAKPELPDDIKAVWESSEVQRSPAEWALKYLWNMEEVGVVLSGMSTMEQTVENARIASESSAGSLSNTESKLIQRVKQIFIDRTKVNCTNCKYCMPCPNGVDIPENFWAYNHDSMFDDFAKGKFWITGWLAEPQRASNCIKCGLCEDKCPQNIEIMKHLDLIKDRYET